MASDIREVCDKCGIEANRLTCLKKYGKEPLKPKFDVSTYHDGICDVCWEYRPITEVRDFFDPDFSLLKSNKKFPTLTFEEYLVDKHAGQYIGLDDDMAEDYIDWIANKDPDEIIQMAEEWGKYLQGAK